MGRRGGAARRPADQRTSPVWPPRPSSACSIARSTETTMSPRCGRRPGGSANASPAAERRSHRDARERLGGQQRERQDVGRAVLAHVRRVQLGELGVIGQDEPDRRRRRGTGRLRAPRPTVRRRPRLTGTIRGTLVAHGRRRSASRRMAVPASRGAAAASARRADATRGPRPRSAGTRSASGTCPSSCRTKASRMRSRSRSVRSHSSNWSSLTRSSMIRVTIARMAGSSRADSERTDASTPSASMMRAASRVCGFGPAWRNLPLVDGRGRLGAFGRRRRRRTVPRPAPSPARRSSS